MDPFLDLQDRLKLTHKITFFKGFACILNGGVVCDDSSSLSKQFKSRKHALKGAFEGHYWTKGRPSVTSSKHDP